MGSSSASGHLLIGNCAEFAIPARDRYTYQVDLQCTIRSSGKGTREDGGPTQAEIGPSLEFYWRSLKKLKQIAGIQLGDSKSKMILLSAGYRYLPTPGSPPTNRVLFVAAPRLPLKFGIVISDSVQVASGILSCAIFYRHGFIPIRLNPHGRI